MKDLNFNSKVCSCLLLSSCTNGKYRKTGSLMSAIRSLHGSRCHFNDIISTLGEVHGDALAASDTHGDHGILFVSPH